MAKAIMIQGTASNVGKSLIATGLCRIFAEDGHRIAPFKSQNISSLSFITRDHLEMSTAQALQARAAGLEPDVRMNPILLKPTGIQGSQIILNGQALANVTPAEFYGMREKLLSEIQLAYDSLSAEHDIIVIEGAGCSAEINLKKSDLVNMQMAKMAKAPVLLVGDIDRGGVFAALYGTVMLQSDEERAYIKGTIINKFKGDTKLLSPAPKMLEELLGIPTVGVVPYGNFQMDAEDTLSEKTALGFEPCQKDDFGGLANFLRGNLDISLIYKILEEGIR